MKLEAAFFRFKDMSKFNKPFFFLLALVLLTGVLLFSSFRSNSQKQERNQTVWPTRDDLVAQIRSLRKELVVYGTRQPQVTNAYKNFAENYATRVRWIECLVKPDSAITPEDIAKWPIWLIGTPASNSLLQKLVPNLPVRLDSSAFSVGADTFSQASDVFVLSTYPNPLHPALPISVITGNSDAGVARFLNESYHWSVRGGDFRVYREDQGLVFGFFKQNGHGPWQIDPEKSRNYLTSGKQVLKTKHYIFIYHGDSVPVDAIQQFANKQERRIQNLLETINPQAAIPRIEYHLYAHPEDKGLMTRNTDLSHFDPDKWQVHAIFNDDLKGDDFYADAKLIFYKFVGQPASPALRDGVGMHFSENWGRADFRSWAGLFYQTGNAVPLSELLDSEIYDRESYLFMRPLAGTFVDFLIDQFGWPTFLELYKTWPNTGLPKDDSPNFSLQKLQQGWSKYLAALKSVPVGTRQAEKQASQVKFQKGFCFAHEGYQIYNGYLSRKSFESLQKLKSLGTNWISLSPFGYLQQANKPGYLRYSSGPGSENDESIITAAFYAKELGMGVLLKPHVLMSSPHWGWPGEIEMATEADWQEFFTCYYSWIRHYALLAEMYDMDMLCVGVELMQATRSHQKEWRDMIDKIRQIYHGPLLYAANWWQEFDQITFWDDLDYIGLNCYYPLSKKDSVSYEDLKNGAEALVPNMARVATQYHKPIIFTEVGFTSTEKSWQNPHQDDRRGKIDLQDQALAYRAVFETFWSKPWFYGCYWWKWPTYLEYGGERHPGFTPNGKPAEQVIAEWYGKKEEPARISGY